MTRAVAITSFLIVASISLLESRSFAQVQGRLADESPGLAVPAQAAPTAPSIAAPAPSREAALAAMNRATTFMTDKVAYRGGYVWVVSDDLTTRWGEVPARPSQVWVQAATPMVGEAFLDAYRVTGDRMYLDAARRAVDVLVFGQHPLGGFHYFIDFAPAGLEAWYASRASKFRFGYEEYRHYYGNATYDDRVTPDAGRLLLRFYLETLEPAYRVPAIKALDFILQSQYPNGAWPQRYPLRREFVHDGLPDYTSYYTLNDGAMRGNVELLLEAHEALGDPRYFEAARRAVEFLIAVQGPDGQAGWAEQYGFDLQPVAARTHEPAGYVIRESRDAIEMLEMFYLLTGDRRYLAPIPRCLAWYERVNREAVELKRPPQRYWQVGTNLPIYVVRAGRQNAEGYGLYEWTTTPPAGLEVRPAVDIAPIRQAFEAIAALETAEARAAHYATHFGDERSRRPEASEVAEVIAALDRRGAWVSDRAMVHPNTGEGWNTGQTVAVRGIPTALFVRNLRLLTAYVADPPIP